MGRFALALGYVLTGDERYLYEYHHSFKYPIQRQPIQPPPSKEMVALIKQLQAAPPVSNVGDTE